VIIVGKGLVDVPVLSNYNARNLISIKTLIKLYATFVLTIIERDVKG